jgi:hypothetical protein
MYVDMCASCKEQAYSKVCNDSRCCDQGTARYLFRISTQAGDFGGVSRFRLQTYSISTPSALMLTDRSRSSAQPTSHFSIVCA